MITPITFSSEGSCKGPQEIKGDVVGRLPGTQRWKMMELEGKGNPDRPLVGLQQDLTGLGIHDPAAREVKAPSPLLPCRGTRAMQQPWHK